MKQLYLNLMFALVIIFSSKAQTSTIELRPSGNGKDALIVSNLINSNWGNHADFAAIAWTSGGAVVARSMIDFEWSVIPSGAIINSAYLSLYAYNSPDNGSHSTASGSNQAVLERITSSWSEMSVTWNNQPSSTTVNSVILPASISANQDYLNINVTTLVKDILENPTNSFGFLFKLVDEQYFRKIVFASGDNPNSNLHPKLVITYSLPIPSDSCIVIRPDASTGKDAIIESKLINNNWGNHQDFAAISWTNAGSDVVVRGLMDFDLSGIPNNIIINSALLSLYSYNSPDNGSHSSIGGSNESVIQRIIMDWNETTVNWNNQPLSTNQNEVILQESTSPNQNYNNINVTGLVKDMLEYPNSSFGFILKLINENNLRKLIFASSDNTNPNLRPELEICFSYLTSISKIEKPDYLIYPNPVNDYLKIDIDAPGIINIEIVNMQGQIVKRTSGTGSFTIDVKNLNKGLYLVRIFSGATVETRKIIVD